MQHLNFDHQSDLFNPAEARAVTVIGVGQVGSQLVETLARIGCSDITVYDDDEVESHNVPMSVYWPEHIMRPKVEALRDIVKRTVGTDITIRSKKYEGEPLKTSVVACVDTMEARMLIWGRVKRNPFVDVFIDTRVAEEYLEVFAVRPCEQDDIEFYERFLYPSSETLDITCGNHGVRYVGGTAANAAAAALTRAWDSRIPKRYLRMLCGDFQEI